MYEYDRMSLLCKHVLFMVYSNIHMAYCNQDVRLVMYIRQSSQTESVYTRLFESSLLANRTHPRVHTPDSGHGIKYWLKRPFDQRIVTGYTCHTYIFTYVLLILMLNNVQFRMLSQPMI